MQSDQDFAQPWQRSAFSWPQLSDPLPQLLLQKGFFTRASQCNPELLGFALQHQQVHACQGPLIALYTGAMFCLGDAACQLE